jgi:hypothetical protein
LEIHNALGLPLEGDRLGCAEEGVRGDRATTGGQVGMGRRPASSLAKGALKDVQAVPVSCPAPPRPPGPPALKNHPSTPLLGGPETGRRGR